MTEIQTKPINPGVDEKDRVTMVLAVHHQHHMEEPVSVHAAFDELMETVTEPYSRRVTLSEEPRQLDCGWIDPSDVKYIVIENYESKNLKTNPSPEELLEIKSRIIEINCGSGGCPFLVAPGHSSVFHVDDADDIKVRCRNGLAKGRITLIAR